MSMVYFTRCLFVILTVFFSATMVGNPQAFDPPRGPGTEPQDSSANAGYIRPTKEKQFKDFVFDTVGPYPLAMAIFTAAIHQGTDNPPEWHQGAVALSKRFGSNMGITAVGNTTRYGLAAMLDEDTSYYRCRCKGVPRRLAHAAFSALMAKRKSDGSSVFSIPALAAPYAATMTATYAWYPARYGAKDAFRMGNYNLLGTVGGNIAFELIPRKVWKGLEHIHLSTRRLAQDQ
jgi:hypothetical protein